jgi:hypothetical protein
LTSSNRKDSNGKGRFTLALTDAIVSVLLKKAGKRISSNDLWLAALSRQHRLPLMSQDRYFDAVPRQNVIRRDSRKFIWSLERRENELFTSISSAWFPYVRSGCF